MEAPGRLWEAPARLQRGSGRLLGGSREALEGSRWLREIPEGSGAAPGFILRVDVVGSENGSGNGSGSMGGSGYQSASENDAAVFRGLWEWFSKCFKE